MRRLLILLLALILVCSMSFPAFAAEKEEKQIDVTVKYVSTVEGEYKAQVQNGSASVDAAGVTISVIDTLAGAVTLVIIPMEGAALSWIDGCVDGNAVAAYDIHFLDADGNRIAADRAEVTIAVSDTDLTVSSVNTSGNDTPLTFSETASGQITFTANGDHYYAISEPVQTDNPSTDSPQTGDNSNLWFWWILLIVSAMCITAICIEQKKHKVTE